MPDSVTFPYVIPKDNCIWETTNDTGEFTISQKETCLYQSKLRGQWFSGHYVSKTKAPETKTISACVDA